MFLIGLIGLLYKYKMNAYMAVFFSEFIYKSFTLNHQARFNNLTNDLLFSQSLLTIMTQSQC